MSLIWLAVRLQDRPGFEQHAHTLTLTLTHKAHTHKSTHTHSLTHTHTKAHTHIHAQETHTSVFSAVLVAKAAARTEVSLICRSLRL
jgi:hypothetical protein